MSVFSSPTPAHTQILYERNNKHGPRKADLKFEGLQ